MITNIFLQKLVYIKTVLEKQGFGFDIWYKQVEWQQCQRIPYWGSLDSYKALFYLFVKISFEG